MKKFKGLLAAILAVVMVLSALPMSVFAAETNCVAAAEVGANKQFSAAYTAEDADLIGRYVNKAKFEDYLFEQMSACNKKIDLSQYNIPYSENICNSIYALINYDLVEIFHAKNYGVWYNTGTNRITHLEVSYTITSSTYKSRLKKCEEAAEELIKDIKGNTNITDVQKALLLHDRIALICGYDYINYNNDTIPTNSYNMYGVLVLGVAVCQGYAETYNWLLEKVGIKNEVCDSEKLNHAWNIVYINGIPYHVDVTWDDPTASQTAWDVKGAVNHNNFLLSTSAMRANGHSAYDYTSTPNDTRYDNYFWKNSKTAFQMVEDELYYIDNSAAALKSYDGTTLTSVSDYWDAGNNQHWVGNFSKLTSDGSYLYYNTHNQIIRYYIEGNSKETINNFSYPSGYSVFGLSYEKDRFYYDVNTIPNFNQGSRFRDEFIYDKSIHLKLTSTYNTASYQTMTIKIEDNVGIAGYWMGPNKSVFQNPYYSITGSPTEKTITVKVTEPGYYCVAAKDVNGNYSKLYYYFYYHKMNFDANGGTVSPSTVVSISTKEITLPVPKRDGYTFMGWATSPYATSGIKKITPNADTTYYATWEIAICDKVKGLELSNTTSGVKLTWNKAKNASVYKIYRSKYSGGKWSSYKLIKNATTTSYTDTSVKKSGEKAKYKIYASNATNKSAACSAVGITYLSRPTTKVVNTTSGVSVSWNKIKGAKNYKVYRSKYSGGKWTSWSLIKTTTSLKYTDKTLKSGTKARYTVYACLGSSESAYKTGVITVYLPARTPKVLRASNGIKVSWTRTAGAKGYIVYRKTYSGGKWSSFKTLGKTTSGSYVDKTAKWGVKYKYVVRAYNGSYKSAVIYSPVIKR